MKTLIKFRSLLALLTLGVTQTVYAVNCGDYVASNVVLTQNLECNSGRIALEVVSNNVTIDLNGFTLSGSRELVGVRVIGYDNLTVQNGSIKGFWAGINSFNSNKLNVSNTTFYEVGNGVILSQGNNARIQGNDFIKTRSTAISITVPNKGHTANQNLISRNEFYRVRGGISICGDQADKNVISDNLIWKSADYGIHLNHSDRNRIYRNRILENADLASLRLNNSSYNEVNNNTIRQGGHVGISVLGNAGDACLDGGFGFSGKNRFTHNQISDFSTAIILGLGLGNQRNVDGTGFLENRITDNNIGVFSQSDARGTYLRSNDFTNTSPPIINH